MEENVEQGGGGGGGGGGGAGLEQWCEANASLLESRQPAASQPPY